MEEPRAWPVLDLPGSCRAEPASPAPKAGPRRSLSHPARLVYGRCSGQGCCPEAQTRTGWVLNGRAFVADQADVEGVNGCGGGGSRPPIEMSPFSPFEMSLSRVTDPPQRGQATPTSSAALLSARVSNGEEGRARYPAHE